MKTPFTLAIALLTVAAAQDTGLYAPAPPANSAFVRVLNTPAATVGTKAITAEKGAASAYIVIPQGDVTAKLGTVSGKIKVEAGNFYSVFVQGGKLIALADDGAENRAKAMLIIYNLSKTASVDLKTADGKTTVITGVKPGTSGSRAVNGITVTLAAFNGTKTLGALKEMKLERGNAYAIVVTDIGVTVTQSSTK
ncbi:alginate O-acetyltransferase AlgF [Deinococcus daejeonensis]|uniref:Alginate biosynthesis protein AlgF n=1 Tax=Deinococcus daejeonensis TaxID=1007098 RepID=A0ABQ2JCD9_9DEIO|nr:alginate O-acetyltransferase AlgF [Deinococcus daejeonensis]GGN44059.1 alginate biosynthesis protein AlgF [Deinococcus daejeonensis]